MVAGIAVGGLGGGVGTDALIDAVKGIADNPALANNAAAANAELKKLIAEARDAAPLGAPAMPAPPGAEGPRKGHRGPNEPPPLWNSVKGVFSGPIGQQLAFGDQMQKRQLTELQGIHKAALNIGAAIAGLPVAVFK
jgi:hypothetical protein